MFTKEGETHRTLCQKCGCLEVSNELMAVPSGGVQKQYAHEDMKNGHTQGAATIVAREEPE